MAKRTTPVKDSPDLSTFVGRCFHVFGNSGEVTRQGVILAPVGSQHYLVQYFESIAGFPSTLAVVPIEIMACAPSLDREPGRWQFYVDADHMNDWYKQHAPRTAGSGALNATGDESSEDVEF